MANRSSGVRDERADDVAVTPSIDRQQAAAWCARATLRPVTEVTIRFWERHGLLRERFPGPGKSAAYKLEDLVLLRIVAEMRRDGLSHRPMRKALQKLSRQLPDMIHSRASRIALTSSGYVVPEGQSGSLMSRTLSSTSSGLAWACDLGAFLRDAQSALEEAA